MIRFLLVLMLLGGWVSLIPNPVHAQPADTTRTIVGILLVQFRDHGSNPDARGSVGILPPAGLDTLENQYRYEDYWNIIFQPSGPVLHPDGDFHDTLARGGHGFSQYGSLRRYMEDNSFGLHTVVPYRAWSTESGLLNTVTPDSSGIPARAIVNWLTLDTAKTDPIEGAHDVANMAIDKARASLVVAWDSLDIVLVYMAGILPVSEAKAGTYKRSGFRDLPYAVGSERYSNKGITAFSYPRQMWHEFLHATINARDLHAMSSSPSVSGVGHFTIMGDNSPLGSYTPEMLDPWHRLRRGWLRYVIPGAHVDSMNIRTPIDTLAVHLPIVEARTNGEIPWVLVIPARRHPEIKADSVFWDQNGQHYFIIENRRAIGWDSVIVKYEMEKDDSYGVADGVGGFIVWSVWRDAGSSQNSPYAWMHDADGDFDTWKSDTRYGEPTDLYTGVAGQDIFSTWSSSGVFDKAREGEGFEYLNLSRNIYIKFAPHVDSSTVNPIARLVIDRFVPAEFTLEESGEGDIAPTKYSGQQKIARGERATLATFRDVTATADRMYLLRGESVEHQREIVWINRLLGEPETVIDNGAVTYFPAGTVGGGFIAGFIMQTEHGQQYNVRFIRTDSSLTTGLPCGDHSWGPFDQPPHPVITSRGAYGAMAYRGDDGIYAGTTTDRGCTWSGPSKLPGSDPGAHSPFILIDSSNTGGDEFLVLFVDVQDTVKMYRSENDNSVGISTKHLQVDCFNPTAARLGTDLIVAFQYRDTWLDRNYIARKRLDLSTSTIPRDWDAFGVQNQESDDIHRDPTIIHTDSSEASKFAMSWNFNAGEKLLWASRVGSPDTVLGFLPVTESVLSSMPTAYPHLLYKEPGYPLLVVSRLGACRGGIWDPGQGSDEDETPSLIFASRGSLPSTITSVTLTELGMDFTQGRDRLMHVRLGMPTAVHGVDTIGRIPYDYSASEAFTTEPIDTLTRSLVMSLADGDLVFFPIDITCHRDAADTMIVEVVLYDPAGGAEVSSSGEYKLPPFTGDTTLTIGLETPNGFPPTECFVSTAIRRGYYTGGGNPTISLCRYMLLGEQTMPKRRMREPIVVARGPALEIHPQPAREMLRFAVEGTGDGEAVLMDLLGRKLVSVPLQGNGTAIRGTLGLGGVAPGMYMLVVRTPDMVRTGKVIVAS